MKSSVNDEFEIAYLKWLLNNVNHVIKLEIDIIWTTSKTIWKSFIDANFTRQYCLPDKIINLKYFHFYIGVKCQLLLEKDDIDKIRNSFKIHPFFISHQWTNVECIYDENNSYHHIFSSDTKKFHFYDILRLKI